MNNDDVVHDPMAVFTRVSAHPGLAMPADFSDKLAAYNERNAHSAGWHRYTADEYGPSRERIRAASDDYVRGSGCRPT